MPAMCSRPHLLHLFRLSCLCLAETSANLPAIKFHGVDSSDLNCRLSDVLYPAQSYLAHVPDSVAMCTSESALVKYQALAARFSEVTFLGTLGLMWIILAR